MACANGRETAFGRIHDYRICRIFQQSGLTCGSRLLSVVIIRHYL